MEYSECIRAIKRRNEPLTKEEEEMWASVPFDDGAFKRILDANLLPLIYSTAFLIQSIDISEQIAAEAFVTILKIRDQPLNGLELRSLLWSRQRALAFHELITIRKEILEYDIPAAKIFDWMKERRRRQGVLPLDESITQTMRAELYRLCVKNAR